jgi:hypothetical protein
MPEPIRPSSILVGFDGSAGAFDAVALGRTLADLTGDDLVVVAVSVAEMSLQAELAGMNLEAGLRRDAEQVLERGAKPLEGSDAAVGQALVASSPGLGLHALAERESADRRGGLPSTASGRGAGLDRDAAPARRSVLGRRRPWLVARYRHAPGADRRRLRRW